MGLFHYKPKSASNRTWWISPCTASEKVIKNVFFMKYLKASSWFMRPNFSQKNWQQKSQIFTNNHSQISCKSQQMNIIWRYSNEYKLESSFCFILHYHYRLTNDLKKTFEYLVWNWVYIFSRNSKPPHTLWLSKGKKILGSKTAQK